MNNELFSLYKEEGFELEDNTLYLIFDQDSRIVFDGKLEGLKEFCIDLEEEFLKESYLNRQLDSKDDFEDIAKVVNCINNTKSVLAMTSKSALFFKELLEGYQMTLFMEM